MRHRPIRHPAGTLPGRLLPLLLLLTGMLVTASMQALSAQALTLATPEETALNTEQARYFDVIRQEPVYLDGRIVRLNFSALEAGSFVQPMPDGSALNIRLERLDRKSDTHWAYTGSVDGDVLYPVTAIRRGDKLRMMIKHGDAQYGIHPIGEGLHVLCVENPADYPVDHDADLYEAIPVNPSPGPADIAPQEPGASGVPEVGTECAVRLLIAYTDDVGAAHADPQLEIELAVLNFNNANNNSSVYHNVEIARVVEVPFNESGQTFGTTLNAFEGTSDGQMDNIHTLRDLYDADLCILVTQALPSYCGLASAIGATYSTAFCVGNYSCIAGNLTLAHEYGHLYGARHDTYVDGGTTPYAYGHGYVYWPGRWRTVMAYNNYCEDQGGSCTRLQYWSNPAITYGGIPMGVAGVSDNESVLDVADATMADFQLTNTNKTVWGDDWVYLDEIGDMIGRDSLIVPNYTTLRVSSTGALTMRAGDRIHIREPASTSSTVRFYTGSEVRVYIDPTCLTIYDPPVRETVADAIAAGEHLAAAPNPFDGQTRISFEITQSGPLFLAVYDLGGHEAAVLADETYREAGSYTVAWRADDLPSGVYVCRLVSGGETHLLKLVVAH